MLALLRSLGLRHLLQKWERSLLVATCICLGVAMLVSTRLLNECTNAAALDTTIPVDQADLYVHNGEPGVEDGIVPEIRAAHIPGVQRVEPFVVLRVGLPELEGQQAVVFGAGLFQPTDSDRQNLEKWHIAFVPVNPAAVFQRPVVISRRLYEERKARGRTDFDPIEIQGTNRPEKFNLLAVADIAKDSPLAPFADNFLAMDVKQAELLMRRPDRLTRIDVFLDKGADAESVKQRIEAIVGTRASVRTAEENRKSTHEIIGGVKWTLTLCSLGAIIVGMFLVYLSVSVTVAERRHDIGVMRSVGATRGQIAALFTMEAMILGLLGSLPGIPLGYFLTRQSISLFGDLTTAFLNGPASFRPVLTLSLSVIAVAAGMLVALLAAMIPAMQAASDQPAEAVRRSPSSIGKTLLWTHRLLCVGLVLAGMLCVAMRQYLPSRTGSLLGMSMIQLGLFLAMPILVRWLARLIHPLCRWLFGVEARLAADNLIRSPVRTGIVIGALAIGVCLMFLTAGVGKSNQVPIEEWLEQVIRADAYLFRGNMASANSSMTPMEPGIRDELNAIPGVERTVGLRFYRPEYGGTFVLLLAIDARDYQEGAGARGAEGSRALEHMAQLEQGNYTIISDNFAAKWKVREGDVIAVPGPRGPVELKVIAVGHDYSWSQGTLFMDRRRYAELFDDPLVDAYHLYIRPDADHDATYESVRKYAERNTLMVQDRDSVRLYLGGMLDRLFQIAYLQQVMVSIVAALGVVMALVISVLQRRRELGLLRAVGATQGQVLKSVLAEAILMGLIGTVLGFLMGLPLEWYLLRVVMQEETGFVFELLIPWKEAIGIGVISLVTATIAGLLPAIHAVRLRITDAIAYE